MQKMKLFVDFKPYFMKKILINWSPLWIPVTAFFCLGSPVLAAAWVVGALLVFRKLTSKI